MGELVKRYINKQRDTSALSVTPPFPRIIKIDVCNTCNYSCLFCPQAKQANKVGNIDDSLCKRIICSAYEAGAKEICLSSTGEPLLNRNLESYIELAKKIGYEYVFFNTNGLLLTDDRAKSIIKAGIDSVKFSINAGEKKYGIIHGGGSYIKVLQNLKGFDRIRREANSKCKLYVSYVATRFSTDEIEEVKCDTAPYVDDIMIMNANNRGGVANKVDEILYIGEDEYSYSFPCSQIFNNVYVTAEGYMVACCQDFENNMVIADLNECSVADAWNCADFVAFREKFLKREYKGLLCDNCLNNTHNEIVPLNEKYAGYAHSEAKICDMEKRIRKLIDGN